MKTVSSAFKLKNDSLFKEPGGYVEVSFDAANTDLYYFTTHDWVALPTSATASNTYYGILKLDSAYSQTIDPINAHSTIGTMAFRLLDYSNEITSLLNTKKSEAKSIRKNRVRIYAGYKELENSDYMLIQTQLMDRQLVYSTSSNEWLITCSDIQRTQRKKIFDLKKTNITASLSSTGITISCISEVDFIAKAQGTSYTDAPSKTVGYIKIEDEVIRWSSSTSQQLTVDNTASTLSAGTTVGATSLSVTDASGFRSRGIGYIDSGGGNLSEISWTGKSSNTLTGVSGIIYAHLSGATIVDSQGRGVFNTQGVIHEYNADSSSNRQLEILEFVYIEEPALDIAKKVYLGTGWPDHWNLAMDAQWVATSTFDDIGTDIYDSTDPTVGKILTFIGQEGVDAQQWLEEEVFAAAGVFPKVLSDGQIGVKRTTIITPYSSPNVIISNDHIISDSGLTYDHEQVYNELDIYWDWDFKTNDYNFEILLEDPDSQAEFRKGNEIKTLKFKGISARRHTDSHIRNLFQFLYNRYSGPPLLISITTFFIYNTLDVGDIVRLKMDNIRDYAGNITSMDRSFEVQSFNVDFNAGTVTLNLFGSYSVAHSIAYATNYVMNDSFYTSAGTDLTTITTGSWSAGTGSTWTITGTNNITGAALSSSAIYYVNGGLEIAASASLNSTHNTQLRVKGHFQINGALTAIGSGLTGGAAGDNNAGTAGAIGNTKSVGSIEILPGTAQGSDIFAYGWQFESDAVSGQYSDAPQMDLINPDGNSIQGILEDGRGTSGGSGGGFLYQVPQGTGSTTLKSYPNVSANIVNGAAGGAGGGSFTIICRSASRGANGYIDISGSPGSKGSLHTGANYSMYSGDGCGGYPGTFNLFIDGNSITILTHNDISANFYGAQQSGERIYAANDGRHGYITDTVLNNNVPGVNFPGANGTTYGLSCYYSGSTDIEDKAQSVFNLQYLPEALVAETLPSTTAALPASFSFNPVSTNDNVAQNLINLEINLVSQPTDANYSYSNVYWKQSTQDTYYFAGVISSTSDLVKRVAADGTTYDVIAKSVSISGLESDQYIRGQVTVASSAQGANMASGNYIAIAKTGYADDATTGFWVGNSAGSAQLNIGNSTNYMKWTGSALNVKGNITADTITANTAGTIAGWTLTSTSLTSGSGTTAVGLSSSGTYAIYAGNTTPASAPFRVGFDGALTASNATISGSITTSSLTASGGTIGGFTITSTSLTAGSGTTAVGLSSSGTYAIYAGNATPASAPFRVGFDGALTASNATISGTITATTGFIGGWTVSSTTLSSGNISLDAGNTRIQAGPSGATYVRISPSGIVGVDSILGTTFNLPTDGSGPTFSSGIINTTVYNISTSGILRTSSTVGDGSANSQGILINDTGIKAYPSSSTSPNVTISATDGTINIVSGTAAGFTISSTSLAVGTGTTAVGLSSSGTYAIYAGNATPASAPFRVGFDGALTATAGTIGGFSINSTSLTAGSGTTAVGLSTTGTYAIYAGNATAASATFRVGFDGSFTAGDTASNKYLNYDSATNLLTVTGLVTASSGQRIELNPSADNELHFYGDRGDTTVAELCTIGITTVGSDSVILNLGDTNTTKIPFYTRTTKGSSYIGGPAKFAYFSVNAGISGVDALYLSHAGNSGYALQATSDVQSYSTANFIHTGTGTAATYSLTTYTNQTDSIPSLRVRTESTAHGPLYVYPKANTTDPTVGGLGQFVVLSDGTPKFFDNAWRVISREPVVGAFVTNATTGSQSITGLGFKPRRLELHATLSSTSTDAESNAVVDAAGATVCHFRVSSYSGAGARCGYTTTYSIYIYNAAGTAQLVATFTSYDSDGFTINLTTATWQAHVRYVAYP